MREFIVSADDLGCDVAYFSYTKTEIVRCRDCKRYKNRLCWHWGAFTLPYDYCSYGERMQRVTVRRRKKVE